MITTTNTTNTLLALYALLDGPHAPRARREIEEIMDHITAPDYDAERAHLLQQEEESK